MATESVELTVEQALAELREMFPRPTSLIRVTSIADYSPNTGGTMVLHQIGVENRSFEGLSVSDCMAQVRAWKEQQS